MTHMIDTTFDFRADSNGKDPDSHSPTLRKYHQLLWSKPLPNSKPFSLDTSVWERYLYHKSDLGKFLLTSDSVIHTYNKWKRLNHITSQFPDAEREEFVRIAYTIGGMLVFPGNRIDGKNTINGDRGFNRKICDRIDLTLECIRRHYCSKDSPLSSTPERYSDFFALFGDFRGYVDFFLLNDLVHENEEALEFFMSFDDFQTSPVPADIGSYRRYRRLSIDFVIARNERTVEWFQSRVALQ